MAMESARPTKARAAGHFVAISLLVVAMLIAAFSLWTVIPLTWIYIGSQLSTTQFPSAGPYMLVLLGIILSIVLIAFILGRLNRLYIVMTGTNTVAPIRPAWLKSLRDSEAPRESTLMETVIVASVVLAAISLGVWFLGFAGSPLPSQ